MEEQFKTIQQQLNDVVKEFQIYRSAAEAEIGNLRNTIVQSGVAYNQLREEVKLQGSQILPPTPRSNPPRIPPPSRYAGGYKTDVSDWLFEVTNFLQASGVADDHKLPTTIALLTGPASKWWQNVEHQHQGITFLEFKKLLVHQFSVVDRERNARDQLYKLKQVRSVRGYSNEFRILILQVPDMDEADKVDRYIRGLKDRNVRAQVLLKKPDDLETAILVAETLDSVYYSVNSGFGSGTSTATPASPGTAMDLDNMQIAHPTPYRRLTPEEKRELREAGGCVYCRARDHPLDRCPKLAARNRNQSGNGHRV